MATLVVPGAVQVTIKMECSGQEVINVIGLDLNFAPDMQTVANRVKTAWESVGGPLRLKPPALKMISYRAVNLNPSGEVAEVSSAAVGGGVNGALSTMASNALINIGAATRNRSQRGRLYHGPLVEGDIDSDGRRIAPSAVTAFTNGYTKLRNDLAAAGNPWVVISRKNASFVPVTTVQCQPVIATQRRRIR